MKNVTVDRDQMKDVLAKNLETHKTDFKEAWDGYVAERIAELKKDLREAKKGGEITVTSKLVRPMSYESYYTKVLSMLDYSTEKEIILTEQEFSHYFLDNWNWKDSFSASNSMYSKGKGF